MIARNFSIALCFALAACQSAGEFRAQSRTVNAGDSAESVVAKMGEPGNRSFREKAEAWQYCHTGVLAPTDSYTTIWLLDGRVIALTSQHAAFGIGECEEFFPEVDWGQAPPDVRIALKIE